MELLLSNFQLSIKIPDKSQKKIPEIKRFVKLHNITVKSINKDIELAREDKSFAVIIAPWFPVKCYYSLYYLESLLAYLVAGSPKGFTKGGHAAVRKQFYYFFNSGVVSSSISQLNLIHSLTAISRLPSIMPGQNTRSNYWKKIECQDSIAKKLMEYKLHDAKSGQKWNLRTRVDRQKQNDFIGREKLMLLDFFYWYRIKANYRDLDYIDFENGITELEVFEYLLSFNNAYKSYHSQLSRKVNSLL